MSSSGLMYAIGAVVTWGVVYTIDQRVLRERLSLLRSGRTPPRRDVAQLRGI